MITASAAGSIVDAHLHVWDLAVSEYAWLGPEHGPLHATFTPGMARAELATAGIASAVLVQAEDSERDTRYLLDAASRHRWIAGVVGWVRLDAPALAAQQLDRWQRHHAFCGVRHLVHDDPRDDFLALPQVRVSLGILAERGLPFDVPDAWPRHLVATAELAAAMPELTIVVDHLAKPPMGRDDHERWRVALAMVARQPNTVAKVSGLQIPGHPFACDTIRPDWETALDLFGSARLMYGGDWPMTVATGGYQSTWNVMSELIGELSPDEQERLLFRTAGTVYGLGGEHI